MINILTMIPSAVMNKPMKHFFLFFFTASFLFLGTVNAKAPAKKYGPVKSGQTLWGIAYKTRPKGITRLEMMDALHKLNPSSFDRGNINRLKKGAMLTLPANKDMVSKLLAGDSVDVAIEDDSNKDMDTLRSELSNVKAELAKSKEALKGLEQAKQSVAVLTKENTALKTNSSAIPEEVKQELASTTEKYTQAQAIIKQLEAEKAKLAESTKQGSQGDNKETNIKLTKISAELKKSQELVKTLAEKNKALQTDSLDPKLLEESKLKLASTSEELEALKVQNQLLREQAATADVSEQERRDSNHKFSEIIAALNSDMGQLRTRIKELEELEKMKDNHIDELQKSLDHATVVIKEQAEVNKKMYARLNAMEKADREKEAQQKEDDDKTAAAAGSNPSNPTPPTGSNSGNNPAIVNFADKPGTSSTSLAVSETMKHISPKFWLMLTLAGLLFVLALLWRMVSGKDEPDVEIAAA